MHSAEMQNMKIGILSNVGRTSVEVVNKQFVKQILEIEHFIIWGDAKQLAPDMVNGQWPRTNAGQGRKQSKMSKHNQIQSRSDQI